MLVGKPIVKSTALFLLNTSAHVEAADGENGNNTDKNTGVDSTVSRPINGKNV